jgi:hypothetical protein
VTIASIVYAVLVGLVIAMCRYFVMLWRNIEVKIRIKKLLRLRLTPEDRRRHMEYMLFEWKPDPKVQRRLDELHKQIEHNERLINLGAQMYVVEQERKRLAQSKVLASIGQRGGEA